MQNWLVENCNAFALCVGPNSPRLLRKLPNDLRTKPLQRLCVPLPLTSRTGFRFREVYQDIFEDKSAVSAVKRSTALAAGNRAICYLRFCFNAHKFVFCTASWTGERRNLGKCHDALAPVFGQVTSTDNGDVGMVVPVK